MWTEALDLRLNVCRNQKKEKKRKKAHRKREEGGLGWEGGVGEYTAAINYILLPQIEVSTDSALAHELRTN